MEHSVLRYYMLEVNLVSVGIFAHLLIRCERVNISCPFAFRYIQQFHQVGQQGRVSCNTNYKSGPTLVPPSGTSGRHLTGCHPATGVRSGLPLNCISNQNRKNVKVSATQRYCTLQM